MNMRPALCAVLCLAAAGCTETETSPDGVFIPAVDVYRMNASEPYACNGYDPISDTCTAVSTLRAGPATFYNETTVLFPGSEEEIVVTGGMNFIMEEGRLCGYGDAPEARARGGTREERRAAEAVFKGSYEAFRLYCTTYYQRPDGQIVSVLTDASGRKQPLGEEVVYFFSRPKPLRPAF